MKIAQRTRLFTALILAVCLTFGVPLLAYGGENDALSEVRELLRTKYVDNVAEEVLSAPTVKEMLARLGDPHTQYLAKTEYDQFLNTLDRAFSGIGVELEIVPEGVLVTKALEGYAAARAGILAGDIITEADGFSLAGKTSEYCVSILRGPEGSTVVVKVKRGTETLSFTLTRMVIELPLVESDVLEEHIGYIAVYSFGQDTVAQFEQHALALKEQGVDSWIIDLRNNGGGYTQAALELLGYFIGDKTAVVLKDKSIVSIAYKAVKQSFTLEGPIILLTNAYTGSSSEIVTAAIKDHAKATLIGENTIGSGRVKALMPLSNGDYLKMTINKFFSPYNKAIDEVGIAPHVDLSGVDELQTAVLMLKERGKAIEQADTGDKSGYIRLKAGPNIFAIALKDLITPQNWQLGRKILDSAGSTAILGLGGPDGWEECPEELLKERQKLYYPDYVKAGNLSDIPLDKKFTVTFTNDMDWETVNADSIEIISTVTGERIKSKFTIVDKRVITVTPQSKLKAASEYWVVVHSSLKDAEGRNITGGVALAETVK